MKDLAATFLDAIKLESRITERADTRRDLIAQIKLLGAGIFRLVVIGDVKRGKSSFINALLGQEDLVPISAGVGTSTIFKIRYGKQKSYRVHFLKESGRPPLVLEDPAQIADFGTKKGNPHNGKQVDFIEVTLASPLLKSGIVIIDTPGLGGLHRDHTRITNQYIPRADAVFFVLDSYQAPITQNEKEYLRLIRERTSKICFVQTMTSTVDEETYLTLKRKNLSIISELFQLPQAEIPYFLVDSSLCFRHRSHRLTSAESHDFIENISDSGIAHIKGYLSNILQPEQSRILAERALICMQPILKHLCMLIENERQQLQAFSSGEYARWKQDLEYARGELHDWQAHKKPGLLSLLFRELDTIKSEVAEWFDCAYSDAHIFQMLQHACAQIDLKHEAAQSPESLAEIAFSEEKGKIGCRLQCIVDEKINKLQLSLHDKMKNFAFDSFILSSSQGTDPQSTNSPRSFLSSLVSGHEWLQKYYSSTHFYVQLSSACFFPMSDLNQYLVSALISGAVASLHPLVSLIKEKDSTSQAQSKEAIQKLVTELRHAVHHSLECFFSKQKEKCEQALTRQGHELLADLRLQQDSLQQQQTLSPEEMRAHNQALKDKLAEHESAIKTIFKNINLFYPAEVTSSLPGIA